MKQFVRRALVAMLLMASVPVVADEAAADGVYPTRMALRDLWVEHVFWVRNFVIAARSDSDAARVQAEREILANARALANSIKPFYGNEASDALLSLLGGHWKAIEQYDFETMKGSTNGQQSAVQALTRNARKIAAFLSGANPFLAESDVFSLLSTHGAHHVSQINQIVKGDYQAEARTWATMRGHMLVLADTLAEALFAQFPDKF